VEDDLRGVGREVDPDLVDEELGVQIAVGGGVVVEDLPATLVGGKLWTAAVKPGSEAPSPVTWRSRWVTLRSGPGSTS